MTAIDLHLPWMEYAPVRLNGWRPGGRFDAAADGDFIQMFLHVPRCGAAFLVAQARPDAFAAVPGAAACASSGAGARVLPPCDVEER
jgi:hypothetical protein